MSEVAFTYPDGNYPEGGSPHERWQRFRSHLKQTPRDVLAATMGVTLALGLLGGYVGGRLLEASTDAAAPTGKGSGGSGAGSPNPGKSAPAIIVPPSKIPAPGSGDFSSNWNIDCYDVTHNSQNTQTTLTPKVHYLGGVANPKFIYTLVHHSTESAIDNTDAIEGINPINVDLRGAIGLVSMTVVYFPNPRHQPQSAADIHIPLINDYPEAQVFGCDPVFQVNELVAN